MLDSIEYLSKNGVFPVLMFANSQAWTLPDLLRENEIHKLQEPATVLDTVYSALDIITNNGKDKQNYWLIPEPVEGPPYPDGNIFYDRKDIEDFSEETSKKIHQILKDLRDTRDIDEFKKKWESFRKNNPEYKKYINRIKKQEQNKDDKELRLARTLNFATDHMKDYIEYRKAKDEEEKENEEDRYKI